MLWTINMEKTGARIDELRRRSGYSVKDLKKAMDPISYQAIYKWQQGQSLPSVDNLVILSELFQVPMDQIIVREYISSERQEGEQSRNNRNYILTRKIEERAEQEQ